MTNKKSLSNEIMKEIINTIDNCSSKKSQQLHYALKVIINEDVLTILDEKEILELFKLVVESKNSKLASLISSVATNKNAINSGEVVELTRLMNECDKLEPKHIEIVRYVATNEYITKSGKATQIVKAVKNNKEDALTIAIHAIEEYKKEEAPKIDTDKIIATIRK